MICIHYNYNEQYWNIDIAHFKMKYDQSLQYGTTTNT